MIIIIIIALYFILANNLFACSLHKAFIIIHNISNNVYRITSIHVNCSSICMIKKDVVEKKRTFSSYIFKDIEHL